ncbi:hypothetical protein [Rodentibacter myodis]|uniref:Uncharacterized protein n=1 Tax=Rodentibacter myodis TaxID=1907939 RepID=A0A1V3JSP4_9PAST|nr:hypothetical protein [Rodentibacter myodis]OOF59722.1 hypothetical protein BKL49_02730 [Rodentibacter myodis]
MKFPQKRQLWRYYLLAFYTIKYILFRFKKWQHPKPLKVVYGAIVATVILIALYLSFIIAVFAFILGLTFLILKFAGYRNFESYYFNVYYYYNKNN